MTSTQLMRTLWTLLACTAVQSWSAALFVSPSGTSTAPYDSAATAATTIQEAVDAAAPGDTLTILQGVYRENVVVNSKSLTLVGDGVVQTHIDGQQSGPALVVQAGASVLLSGLTLRNGVAELGGGIRVQDAGLSARNVHITGCRAGRGGGIYANNSVLTLEQCLIQACDAYLFDSSAGKGGAVYVLYTLAGLPATFTDCSFFGNRAVYGALRFWSAEAILRDCHIAYNRAEADVLALRLSSSVDLINSLLHHNQSLSQSIVACYDSCSSQFVSVSMTENECLAGEGALYMDPWAELALYNTALQRNVPDNLELNPDAVIASSLFSTAPAGFGLSDTDIPFSGGPDGDYFLAPSAAAPTAYIATGTNSAPYSVDPATHRCYASDDTPATNPNIGYCYPFGAEGQLALSTLPEWSALGSGQMYRHYVLEHADTLNFANPAARAVGPLSADTSALDISAPTEDGLRFHRLTSHAPLGNSLAITLLDNAETPIAGVRVDVINAEGIEWYAAGTTAADGSVLLQNLANGTFTVLAATTDLDYIITYLGNATLLANADHIALHNADHYAAQIQLATGNRIAGQTRTMNPLAAVAGTVVSVYNSEDTVVKSAISDASGDYDIGGLLNGTYRIGATNTPQFEPRFYNNQADLATATGVNVSAAQTVNDVNLLLPRKFEISGVVTLPDEGALHQIAVVLYDASTFEELAFSFCDPAGGYALYATNGDYVISAGEGSEYVVNYSQTVTINGAAETALDFFLSLGGTISGKITDSLGAGISDVYVDIYETDGTTYVDSTVTSSDGSYSTPQLAPGSYLVLAYGDPVYANLWYPGTTNAGQATPISVIQGQNVPTINVQLPVAQ